MGPTFLPLPLRAPDLGCFEVWFMGVKIFSKLKSGLWPRTAKVAQKCQKVYYDYLYAKDINQYEAMTIETRGDATARDTIDVRASLAGKTINNDMLSHSRSGGGTELGMISDRRHFKARKRNSPMIQSVGRAKSALQNQNNQKSRTQLVSRFAKFRDKSAGGKVNPKSEIYDPKVKPITARSTANLLHSNRQFIPPKTMEAVQQQQ